MTRTMKQIPIKIVKNMFSDNSIFSLFGGIFFFLIINIGNNSLSITKIDFHFEFDTPKNPLKCGSWLKNLQFTMLTSINLSEFLSNEKSNDLGVVFYSVIFL